MQVDAVEGRDASERSDGYHHTCHLRAGGNGNGNGNGNQDGT
jgi:hypothetical protein